MRHLLLAAVALAGCAHLPGHPGARHETVRAGDAVVELRYQPEDEDVALQLKAALPRSVAAAERWGKLSSPVLVTIHPTHEALEAASHQLGRAWLRAWARYASLELQSPRTWSNPPGDAEVTQLLTHELTHCAMFQSAGRSPASRGRGIPVWFQEGMAGVTAGEQPGDAELEALRRFYRDEAARGAHMVSDTLLRDATALDRFDADLVYDAAGRAFRFLLDRYGDAGVRGILASMLAGHDFPQAFRGALGIDVPEFEREFRRHVLQLAFR